MDDNQQPPPPPASVYPPPPPPGSTPATYHHHPLLHQQQLQQLKTFWTHQRTDIEQTNDFKNHQLPLARIKKIMKADEDVRMISAEAPILFAKACELFILELTIRSWLHAEENKRRTLQKNDIAAAITRTDIFDFLVDIVPREEVKEEEEDVVGNVNVNVNVPYYYNPPPGGVYAQVPSQAWQSVWQNSGGGDDVSYGSGGSGNVDHQGPANKALDDRSSAKRPANVSRQERSTSSRTGEKDCREAKLRALLKEKGLPTSFTI